MGSCRTRARGHVRDRYCHVVEPGWPKKVQAEVRSHFWEPFFTVAAVYDRRFYGMLQEKPAVIDRRYSGKASLRAIEFVSELRTQDIRRAAEYPRLSLLRAVRRSLL